MQEGTRPLSETLDWVNIDEPVRLESLQGKVVLLWFWTYDNIHCLNMLPILQKIASSHADGVALLGLHVPKYVRQRQTSAVASAVRRYDIRFPVASDPAWQTWQDYKVTAWPGLVVLDCTGHRVRTLNGERSIGGLEQLVDGLLEEAVARDQRNYLALPAVRFTQIPDTPLRFPAAVALTSKYVYICDSARHRVIECNRQGRVLRQFGAGSSGYWDGRLNDAGFSSPQSLALSRNALYVADTGNHAVRRIDLHNGQVDTVLGNGQVGYDAPATPGTDVSISAPVGLFLDATRLYVALAGQHQIWRIDLANAQVAVLAGSGRNEFADGKGAVAGLVQPAVLAALPGRLLLADAGGNAIRAVRMENGEVETLLGHGTYIDPDADPASRGCQLMHPLGLAVDRNGKIYVSDTLGLGLCVLSLPKDGKQASGKPVYVERQLREPTGLALEGRHLWVCERNAHAVIKVDLDSGGIEPFAVVE